MTSSRDAYGPLIAFDPEGGAREGEELIRVPLGASVEEGGVSEESLQNLLFHFPRALPTEAIDRAYADAVPVCTELWTDAGYLDALYVNRLGRLTLAEFKLWRNPEARREVIGQILDYAKELASWGYEDLQRRVSLAHGRKGNVLYDLVRERHPEVDEAEFVDNVTRHLKRGEFLMLIVGDGIREGVENIVDFVQRHSGLHFNLALVEAALWRGDGNRRLIVQPRVLARTEIVKRAVVEGGAYVDAEPEGRGADTLSNWKAENHRFWTAVTNGFKFSDVTVEPPLAAESAVLPVQVANSGFNGWGLWFSGYIDRRPPGIGCYLSPRSNIQLACRIHEELTASIEDLKAQMGGDLLFWRHGSAPPRIGFQRPGGIEGEAFDEAVAWMRKHLDRLVSTLNPRIQSMIRDGG